MAGMTLMELMISMAIGLGLTTVISAVYVNTSRTRTDLERIGQVTDNARFAIDLFTEDLRHAGFYGPFVPTNDATYTDPAPCNTVWNTLGWNLGVTPLQMPAAISALDDPALLPAGWDCLPQARPGTDILTIRRAVETTTLPADITTNTVPYVQASQCTTDPAPIAYDADPGQFVLRNITCDPPAMAPVPVRQYITRTYYVASCNQCAPDDGIPTLKRMELRDGVLTLQPLAEGITGLQLQYGFDLTDNGNVDAFQTGLNGIPGDPGNDWSNVVAVRMNLLVQSTGNVSGPADTRTYDLGPGHTAETCAAGRRCVLAAGTVRLINVAARRETP